MDDSFQILFSADAKTWTEDPNKIGAYLQAYRTAKERSIFLKRYERITRPDLKNAVLITFFKGMPIYGL